METFHHRPQESNPTNQTDLFSLNAPVLVVNDLNGLNDPNDQHVASEQNV